MRTHGVAGTYYNGCRCEECRSAATEYQREARKRRRETIAAKGGDPYKSWHGTTRGYNYYQCRCERCRRAWADKNADYWKSLNADSRPTAAQRHERWTDEDIAIVRDMSLSHAEAAEILGRTWTAVRSARKKLTNTDA